MRRNVGSDRNAASTDIEMHNLRKPVSVMSPNPNAIPTNVLLKRQIVAPIISKETLPLV
jgi:hypothetical protein